jgi:hypothetical protein
MPRRWSDVFTLISQRKVGHCLGKTTPADELTWEGIFDGQPICVVSTVRLTSGNLAHFLTHSGARIGTHDWNLVGGHFVDLVVHARRPLDTAQLLSLGQLAMTEDTRPVCVRRHGEDLKTSLDIPRPS